MRSPPPVSIFDVRPDLRVCKDDHTDASVYQDCTREQGASHHTLEIPGDLDLWKLPITTLPDGLSVGGDLILSGTRIAQLPMGLLVGGRLDLCHTQIAHLPEDLTVGNSLHLYKTSITHLPRSLHVGGRIFPPDTLHDLKRLRRTLRTCRILYGDAESSHTQAQIYQSLLPYPDVLRIWQSMSSRTQWIITPTPSSVVFHAGKTCVQRASKCIYNK